MTTPKKRRGRAKSPPLGRPPLPDDERLSARIEIRVSAEELAEVRKRAARAGLNVSDWLRGLALG